MVRNILKNILCFMAFCYAVSYASNEALECIYAFANIGSVEYDDSLYESVNNESPYSKHDVCITTYRPVIEECWGDPLVTASMAEIDTVKLNNGQLRWCAVSRDLLGDLKYGDVIDVYISDGHRFNGKWLVQDTMNKRWTKRIDLLISENIAGGKWDGNITFRRHE